MKHILLSATILAATSAVALADGPAPTPVDPVVMTPADPQVADWSGFYGGLSYGMTSGDVDFTPGGAFDFEDGHAVGAFVGYNWQNGNLVYGGELAYSEVSEMFIPGGFGDDDEITYLMDARARIGYASGNALFYAAAGFSSSEYIEPGVSQTDLHGYNYGVGVDFLLTENVFFGVDYTHRTMDGTMDGPRTPPGVDVDVNTFSLRLGFNF